jgi:hypothetical protein
MIIGCSLGDLCIRKQPKGINARLEFLQGLINESYLLHLYDLLKDFSPSFPRKSDLLRDKRTDKVYTNIRFETYSLPCFNYYRELFYVNGVKIIPLNIGELLTPVSLAYWAMEDGTKRKNGFIFCTDSYTLNEIELLIKVLKENFDLNCTSQKVTGKDQYRIYIKSESMDKFRFLVTPYFHESMMYKLAIK